MAGSHPASRESHGKKAPTAQSCQSRSAGAAPWSHTKVPHKCWAVTALGAHQQTPTQPVPARWGHLGQSPHFSANNIRHDSFTLLSVFSCRVFFWFSVFSSPIKMRKGCNVFKSLDTLPKKVITWFGKQPNAISGTYLPKETKIQDRAHTHWVNQAEGWIHPGNSHFSPCAR